MGIPITDNATGEVVDSDKYIEEVMKKREKVGGTKVDNYWRNMFGFAAAFFVGMATLTVFIAKVYMMYFM